jgi:predicted dehydrogenase
MNVAIVGCGSIAARYARDIAAADGLELVAATDALPERAAGLAAEFGGIAYESLPALLADENVELLVNLTGVTSHVEVTAAALEAGKHVHSEKPLALRYEDARALVELAEARGVLLSASPATLLGEAQQTFWKLLREQAIGRVRVAYAEANWGHIESWHPTPMTIYAAGPAPDVGVYPLAILTAVFGPVTRVTAYGTTVEPNRVDIQGVPFRIETPDLVVALCELQGGVVVRLTASFYVGPGRQRGIEVHGDGGMMHLARVGRGRFAPAAVGHRQRRRLPGRPARAPPAAGNRLVPAADRPRRGRPRRPDSPRKRVAGCASRRGARCDRRVAAERRGSRGRVLVPRAATA